MDQIEIKEEKIKQPKQEFKTDFEKSMLRKERILNAMKSIDISSLISLESNDFSKFPRVLKMPRLVELNPILQKKLEEEQARRIANDKRKVYSLDEYCAKFMN